MSQGNGKGAAVVDRVKGSVKWFNAKKGYGFATSDGKDIFVHVNNLPEGVETLREGQALSFVVETTRKGIRATSIVLE